MIVANRNTTFAVALLVCVVASLCSSPVADASVPISLRFAGQFGREVNETEAGKGPEAEDVCLASIGDKCRKGKISSIPGGFSFPFSVAVDKATGDVYVDDDDNNRIQMLGPNGEFLLMWGQGVNKKGGNVCKAGEECQAGTAGGGAGQLNEPRSVAVDNTCFEQKLTEPKCKETDPADGNVYVLEGLNHRVSEFGPEGQFILMFGGKVNKDGKNICEASESSECQSGETGTASGFFEIWAQYQGDLVAVGGPEHLVYVADQGRVQEFEHTGAHKPQLAYKTQVTLTSTTPAFATASASGLLIGVVTGLAVDGAGNLYVTESYFDSRNEAAEVPKGIYEFAPNNPVAIKQIDASDSNVEGMAIDESGHMAITNGTPEGVLFELSSGQQLSRFQPPGGLATGVVKATGLSFNGQGTLYLADSAHQSVEMFSPVSGAELLTNPFGTEGGCKEGVVSGGQGTVDCPLEGEVNPEGISETEVWFEWGAKETLGSVTPREPVPTASSLLSVTAPVSGLLPNETYYFELAAFDHNFLPPVPELSSLSSFVTPTVPPRVMGQLSSSFVKSSAAVLAGEVNPEHASSEYFMEYGTSEALVHCPEGIRKKACTGVASTPALESDRYQTVRATFEATGLQPNTEYKFRLNAINGKEQVAVNETGGSSLPEGAFTTAPPVTPQAVTGQSSEVTATGAVISGQVDPDGEPASYAFELGVYAGAETQYGTVETGSAGEGTAPVNREMQLSGLHPSTTYAYRIKIESPYVQNETHTLYGAPSTFTTGGLPIVLSVPAEPEMLRVPKVAFPKEPPKPPRGLTRKQKLKRALQACDRKRSKRQRMSCQSHARKQYGSKPKKKHGGKPTRK